MKHLSFSMKYMPISTKHDDTLYDTALGKYKSNHNGLPLDTK